MEDKKEIRVKADMPIADDIKQIFSVFKKNKYKMFVVGGAVRDFILNKPIKDFDLVTDALPDKVEEMMSKAGFRTIATGKSFGVINVFSQENEYEVATFRADGAYTDQRRPDSVTFSDIYSDVKRRDLTCNALYYDLDTKEIIDLVGGIEDINNGIVRTVGNPTDRFGEDKLRILRAIRFAGRFGNELDQATDLALQQDSDISGISGERIRDEFIKGLTSAKDQKQYLKMLDKYGLLDTIFKGLNLDKKLVADEDVIIVIANLLKGNQPSIISKVLNNLKYTSEEIKRIVFLVSMLKLSLDTVVPLKKAEEHAGVSPEQITKFCGGIIPQDLLKAFLRFRLSVSGLEVMDKMNIKAGPELGKMITKMEIDNFKKLIQ